MGVGRITMFTLLKRIISKLGGLIGVRQLKFKKGKQRSLGRILEKQASRRPGKTLILFEDQKISYQEFNRRANQVAHLFLSMNFKKGDTVAMLIPNRPEFLIIHTGLAKIGVIPALINTQIKERALIYAVNTAEAKSLIVGHECMEEVIKIQDRIELSNTGQVFLDKEGLDMETPDGMLDFSLLLQLQPKYNPSVSPSVTTRDTLEYIYTSGTTGFPRATTLTHHKWIQIGLGAGGLCLGAIPKDVIYCCIPLFHNSGINLAWSITLLHGGTLALRRKFSASHFWEDTRKFQCTIFIYIGELCRYLNNQPPRPDDRDNPLQYIFGTGMRADYWCQFQERFNIKKIIEVYATTEGVGALINLKGVPGMIGRLCAAGMRMGEVARYDTKKDTFIYNRKGFVRKCKPGEVGMFLARIGKISPFSGYKNNGSATRAKILENVFQPGDRYFISGDLFLLHKNDYVSFVDRLGDSFRWKGELVSTNEVGDIINKFDSIEDSNVYGVKVKDTEGRAGMTALTMLPGADIDWNAFSNYIIKNLPTYARPYFVRILEEKDVTSTFKQVKFRLQEQGFDPAVIKDPLYFLDPGKKVYVKLTNDIYEEIQDGKVKW